MIRAFRSTPAGFTLLALLAVQLGACTATQNVPLTTTPPAEISGVIMKSGRTITFEPKGVIVSRDTVYANTSGGQVIIPGDSIMTARVRHVSTGRTVGLVAVTLALLAGFVALADNTAGHCYPCN